MNYFKMYYQACAYSKNWYGILNYAPTATILLYNDAEGYCIGHMEESIYGVQPLTEAEALAEVNAVAEVMDVWKGDKLATRWDEVLVDGELKPKKDMFKADFSPIKKAVK